MFNKTDLFKCALINGKVLWSTLPNADHSDIHNPIHLASILESHLQSLVSLYSLSPSDDGKVDPSLTSLKQFCERHELRNYKRINTPLHIALKLCSFSSRSTKSDNYYTLLQVNSDDDDYPTIDKYPTEKKIYIDPTVCCIPYSNEKEEHEFSTT